MLWNEISLAWIMQNDSSRWHARIFFFYQLYSFFCSCNVFKRCCSEKENKRSSFHRVDRNDRWWSIDEMNENVAYLLLDLSFLSMCLPCETTRIVEKLTLSSKRAAWNRSIYGPWGLRVQVLPPPLHATWRKYSAIGTVMFNMRPVYINYWTGRRTGIYLCTGLHWIHSIEPNCSNTK